MVTQLIFLFIKSHSKPFNYEFFSQKVAQLIVLFTESYSTFFYNLKVTQLWIFYLQSHSTIDISFKSHPTNLKWTEVVVFNSKNKIDTYGKLFIDYINWTSK